jgi:hypothetical protein
MHSPQPVQAATSMIGVARPPSCGFIRNARGSHGSTQMPQATPAVATQPAFSTATRGPGSGARAGRLPNKAIRERGADIGSAILRRANPNGQPLRDRVDLLMKVKLDVGQ